ncbi:FAM13A protein [Rhizoctonia solani AG-3 Rhs1AP]|uniref:FAM13A protein n=1 Tax=Rhizoctonia solani AG-3 Rhs1AP TaxID=1086054 RepID=X8J4H3_9AGAM|nr:FAM13A protein [Rhizoctonia solani AG-3 Rhs1AP]
MLKTGHSSMASEPTVKSRSIKFSDPFAAKPRAPFVANRLATTRSIPPLKSVRRSNTVAVGPARFPRPARGSTVKIEEHAIVGKATPGAQFEMVSPPRSPTNTSPSKGSRLPLRAKSAEPSNRMDRTATLTRGLRRRQHCVGVHRPDAAVASESRSSMIPTRRETAVMGWAESQATFKALTSSRPQRNSGRGRLPSAWTSGVASQRPSLDWRSSSPAVPPDSVAEAERRRTNSEPEVKFESPSYPQLTPEERIVLVRKLRALLKCAGIDDQALDTWEKSPVQEAPAGNPGGVFGRSIKESSPYASCQVVLGEHSHNLPICVFASVEEICRRGVAASGLFLVSPPLNKRTVEKLTCRFDQGPSYGVGVSLAKEDTSNICALLKLYLRALPEAVLSHSLWSIIQQLTLVHNNDVTVTPVQVAAIQAILHLQHPTSFSLLVYLFAFLHQLVLHGSQNGLTIPTLAGIFGPTIFSPRKANAVRTGCSINPSPENQVLVKTFQSAHDVAEGTRVMTWVLEHWDGIATGLLSLDIVHGSEKDIPAWEASWLKGSLAMFRGDSDGQYSEGARIDESVDPTLDNLVELHFPEAITVDRVPVHEVCNSIVEIPPPHSTRASSPATFWSQETGPNPTAVSRTASLETAKPTLEPVFVQELRRRMITQEAELASLRQELALIRSRFVFPLPPNDMLQNIQGNSQTDKSDVVNIDTDEDTMPTPRPPSGPHCAEFPTMSELIDSKPVTPLFHKIWIDHMLENKSAATTDPTLPMDDAKSEETSSSSTSDSGVDTPPNEPAQGFLFVANPDPTSEEYVEMGSHAGKLQELLTARDALRSALAAMDPVRAQLKAVEEELEHRNETIL